MGAGSASHRTPIRRRRRRRGRSTSPIMVRTGRHQLPEQIAVRGIEFGSSAFGMSCGVEEVGVDAQGDRRGSRASCRDTKTGSWPWSIRRLAKVWRSAWNVTPVIFARSHAFPRLSPHRFSATDPGRSQRRVVARLKVECARRACAGVLRARRGARVARHRRGAWSSGPSSRAGGRRDEAVAHELERRFEVCEEVLVA